MTFFKYLAVLCAGAASAALASCDNELDVQQSYEFTVETMPVPKELAKGETAEIRCELKRSGEFADALYTVRYFQYDGEGTLSLDNSLVLLPNDRYLLENEKFRLYYTSGCEESQNFVVVVEDNFGQSCELEFDFQHDSGDNASDADLPDAHYPIDSLITVN
ncbi:conjugal transfer protein TraQ [Muribaculum sp. An289]|nr:MULTISPECIES: DUF3872 domain-containing protein [unclassified Muribaculum]OUO38065.1 conjugal transfer protein TraQ [Muribaculum sp. An289]OUO44381.1 conjugal transfer protein TraQ [Muribaculum sp. An287]